MFCGHNAITPATPAITPPTIQPATGTLTPAATANCKTPAPTIAFAAPVTIRVLANSVAH